MRALLLAAGHGKRAGGPKAWAPFEGKTLLERQVEFLLTRTKPEEIFISIQAEWLERCQRIEPHIRWVVGDPEETAFGSLKRIASVAQPRWATVHHVDMPVWEPGLFRALEARAATACGAEAIVPVHDGRRGHPVILAPRLQRRIASGDPSLERLDALLREARVEEAPVTFPCVLENWNAPIS